MAQLTFFDDECCAGFPVAAFPASVDVAPQSPRNSETNTPDVEKSGRIVATLHETGYTRFVEAAKPMLNADERRMLAACGGLPWQCWHHAWSPFLERVTRLWGALEGGWEPFAQVIEPATDMPRGGPRVITLELLRPTRSLEGRVAFAVQRDLAAVSQPIPRPVIELMKEYHDRKTFTAIAFLEPVFESSRRGARVLRSQAEVRRVKCRPIDPLVVGFLGDGPFSSIRFPTANSRRTPVRRRIYTRPASGHLLFLLGHWD